MNQSGWSGGTCRKGFLKGRSSRVSSEPAGRSFARWHVSGRQAGLIEPPVEEPAEQPDAEGPEPVLPGDAAPDAEFDKLWDLCRAAPPRENGQLLDLIRDYLGIWRTRVAASLRAAEPRDRLLALQVIGTPALAPLFRAELEALRNDPADAIRRLVNGLLMSVSTAAQADVAEPAAGAPEPAGPPDAVPAADSAAIDHLGAPRQGLHQLLTEIAASNIKPAELAMLVEQLRPLLREIMASPGSDPPECAENEARS